MAHRLVALLLALALAGCITQRVDEAQGAALEAPAPISPAVLAEVAPEVVVAEVPVWSVGDAWTVTSHGFGEEQRSNLVVTSADSDGYTLETTNEQAATWDAMFDVSYIGRIRASDLAGGQQGTPVRFFDFPLEDGKTWTTRWDGFDVALTATKSALGFDIVGTVGGEPYVVYDYVPDLRWWSHLEFVREGYGMKVERVESDWRGEVLTATAKLVYEGGTAAPVLSPGTGAFTLDEGQTFGLVTVVGGGAHWARAFQLIAPDGSPHMSSAIENVEAEAAQPRSVFLQEEIPPTPGQWHILAPALHDPDGGFVVTVHQVALVAKPVPSA